MLGKGLESLIPSGGHKQQQGAGGGSSQEVVSVSANQPVSSDIYEPTPRQFYNNQQQSVGMPQSIAPRPVEFLEATDNSPAPYYDYSAPIIAPRPIEEPARYSTEREESSLPPVERPLASPSTTSPENHQVPQIRRSEDYADPSMSYRTDSNLAEEVRPAISSYDRFVPTEKERELSAPGSAGGHHLAPILVKEDYSTNGGTVYQIDVSKIFPNPHQPRRHFDESALSDLANSIREFGIIQPLVVTKMEGVSGDDATYQLIAGERRLMAAKRVGLKTVPAVIKSVGMDRERLELAIIENIQRENLNPLEAARSYARLQDEFGLTQREIASRMGKSRETIANTLRLLNLPTEVQQALEEGRINESHARLLLQVDDIARQKEMFSSILKFKPSVRELKAQLKRGFSRGSESRAYSNPELLSLQARLEETLGTKVQINDEGDKGRITINYYSADELSDLISKLSRSWGNY